MTTTATKGRLLTPEHAKSFVLAGNATITLVSEKTGARYTFRIRGKANEGETDFNIWFVSVMYGPDNESQYTYLGFARPDGVYAHGRKSKVGPEDARARAFGYFWQHLASGKMPPQCEVWHSGSCGRCGRKLTVPDSIALGIGPECRKFTH